LSEKSTFFLVTSYKCLWWVQCTGLLGLTIQEFCFGFCVCVTFTNFLQPNPLITMFWQDPVCGSAHCVLAPYWGGKLGKHKLTAFQVRSCTTLVFPWSIIDWGFDFIHISLGIPSEWNTIPGVRSCTQESANSGRSCQCDDWYPPSISIAPLNELPLS
jgi:hypothetical protein